MVNRAAVGSVGGVLELATRWRIEWPAGLICACGADGQYGSWASSCRNSLVCSLYWHLQVNRMVHVVSQFERVILAKLLGDAGAGLEAIRILVIGGHAVSDGSARCVGGNTYRSEVRGREMTEGQFAGCKTQSPEFGHSWIGGAQNLQDFIDVTAAAIQQ